MQRETPDWMTHFIKGYGTSGLIVMAWWLGARNAPVIRELQQSFPFLQVTAAGLDKHAPYDLVSTLSHLSGGDEAQVIRQGQHSPSDLKRALFQDTDQPLVLSEMGGMGTDVTGWDMLKPLFNNCRSTHISPGVDRDVSGKPFVRGLVFLGEPNIGPALLARTVQVRVDMKRPWEVMTMAAALVQGTDVLSLSPWTCAQLYYRLGAIDGHIQTIKKACGGMLAERKAKNSAQLVCLVHALADIFNVPKEVRINAVYEIHDSAAAMYELPF